MGVCDYTCFIHSTDEGGQCLSLHTECSCSTYDEDNSLEDCESETLLSCAEHTEDSCGAGSAHLFIYEIKDVNTWEEALEAVKNRKYTKFYIEEIGYVWDEWSFKKYEGYMDVLSASKKGFDASIWKPTNHENLWIFNVCPSCYELIIRGISATKNNHPCSKYLREISEKHEIEIEECMKKSILLERIREKLKYFVAS